MRCSFTKFAFFWALSSKVYSLSNWGILLSAHNIFSFFIFFICSPESKHRLKEVKRLRLCALSSGLDVLFSSQYQLIQKEIVENTAKGSLSRLRDNQTKKRTREHEHQRETRETAHITRRTAYSAITFSFREGECWIWNGLVHVSLAAILVLHWTWRAGTSSDAFHFIYCPRDMKCLTASIF